MLWHFGGLLSKYRLMKRLFLLSCWFVFCVSGLSADWPFWRGDLAGSGISGESDLPTEWGREKNVKWKVDLPEPGNSTPVIFGDRIFVTQPISETSMRTLMCLDRKTGKKLWQKGIKYTKKERTHRTNHYCSASPATDGDRVIVAHGSAGLFCYSPDGEELWKRDFGAIDHVWGSGSSPLIYKDLCIHYYGPGKGAFLVGLDKNTGKTLWKFDEPDWKPGKRTDGFRGQSDGGIVGSFSTPILVNSGKRDELIMSFPMEMKAFDPSSGKVLWTCEGLNPLVYTSPVYDGKTVVALGGYYGNSIAVKTGGSGDVTNQRLWQQVRHHGGIGTGVAKDGFYWFNNSAGIVYCLDLKTGETKWKERLPGKGNSWGSFTLVGDKIYSLSQSGETAIFKTSPKKLEVISHNVMEEKTNSSISVSDGELFIRTHKALWCVAEGLVSSSARSSHFSP